MKLKWLQFLLAWLIFQGLHSQPASKKHNMKNSAKRRGTCSETAKRMRDTLQGGCSKRSGRCEYLGSEKRAETLVGAAIASPKRMWDLDDDAGACAETKANTH